MKFIVRKFSDPDFESSCIAVTIADFKAIQFLYGGPLVIDFKEKIIWVGDKEKEGKNFSKTP